MTKNTEFSITSAERYSLALFELAEENNLLIQIEDQALSFLNLINHSDDFYNLVKDPTINQEDLLKLIDKNDVIYIFPHQIEMLPKKLFDISILSSSERASNFWTAYKTAVFNPLKLKFRQSELIIGRGNLNLSIWESFASFSISCSRLIEQFIFQLPAATFFILIILQSIINIILTPFINR